MAVPASANEFDLASPPSDGISRIRFAPTAPMLMVSSWDSTVRLYDVYKNTLTARYNHKAAVLTSCWSDDYHCFSGGLDKTVKLYDVPSAQETVVGEHEGAVRCLEWNRQEQLVISGSWDGSVRLWDMRARERCTANLRQPERVYTMDVIQNKLVVGTAGRHIWIWDLRRMKEPEQRRESSLKYQTRCLRAYPDGSGFAVSSIEGRVAMEYFDPSPDAQAKKYAFKCHRTKTPEGIDQAYPVNEITFHPVFGTFATGGGDGMINVWDGRNKKRLCQFHKYPTSIASIDFSRDGALMAIASSYTFEELDKPHPADTIFIRQGSEEFRPKPKQ
eukprot:TRINITY_DN5799_c0_g1_i1.p1 TRINITY_DN5799_c0_g1~~TRINITY_DN5799_c0_g1_i1.p1  ORF type:complete len:331 (+),score=67.71 TRINITY_DN5799_c0_g1_i1:44-1036(+)